MSLAVTVADDASGRFDTVARLLEGDLADIGRATAAALLDRARGLAEGEMLRDVDGTWLESLRVDVATRRGGFAVTLADDADYAGILELGGHTGPHEIRPDDSAALYFLAGGTDANGVFAAVVHDPGATIAPHPVLRTALADLADPTTAAIGGALRDLPGKAGL